MGDWFNSDVKNNDVVVSSRVRLARNIKGYNFSHTIDDLDSLEIIDQIKSIVDRDHKYFDGAMFYRLKNLDVNSKKAFIKRHLISKSLVDNSENSAFVCSKDKKKVIMINEEDHIRIQVVLTGMDLKKAWMICDSIDNVLEKSIDYAFDEKLGYLTACPTNVGTGLRVSALVHLPCLVLTRQINNILQVGSHIGISIRGLYGEGSNILGNMFQISNQVTLGESEKDLVIMLRNMLLQVISKERSARELLLSRGKIVIEDKVYRALGILKNVRIITLDEGMKLLSDIRMGCSMGLIDNTNYNNIDKLMIDIQSAIIQKNSFKRLSQQEINIKRATILRKELADLKNKL